MPKEYFCPVCGKDNNFKTSTCICGYEGSFELKIVEDESTTGNKIDPEGVNHPKHYNNHPSGVECIDVIEHMSFNIGNCIKYAWRADLKGNKENDLKKAKWYIEREMKRLGIE